MNVKHRRLAVGAASAFTLIAAVALFFASGLMGSTQTGTIRLLKASPTLTARLPALRMPTPEQLRDALPGDTRSVVEHSDTLTVLALEPLPYGEKEHSFRDYPIVGGARVEDAPLKTALVSALYTSIAEQGAPKGCFVPHHGLRAVRGSRTVDLLICFSCDRLFVFDGPDGPRVGLASVSDAAAAVFDQALKDAGVPRSLR